MEKAQIQVVEDNRIIALGIQGTLSSLGYIVSSVVSSGEESIKRAEEDNPDLVLMDIVLEGEMDGIEAAEQIRSRFNIPVVYLTAYADEKKVERAKLTEPFGYIIKPFEDRELHFIIEIALYRNRIEKRLKESEEWLYTTLKSIGDAVIATDTKGHVTFMNPSAQALTGWKEKEASGKRLKEVFNIINEKTGKSAADPVSKVIHEGRVVGLANHTVLIAKDGTKVTIDDSGAPIKDERGNIIGVVLIFRDITERKRAEEKLKESLKEKEVLLREIHHRVKNNLQIISSLINLQSYQIRGKQNKELFKESQNRIKSIALIHEKLYQSKDLARINFKEYTEALVSSLFRSYGYSAGKVVLNIESEKILLGVDNAIPCGLIINELVSNSLKHAFPDGKKGEIKIGLHSSNEKDVELEVSDNGVGIPEDLDLRKTKSLGLHLVTILAEDQLHGRIRLSRKKGTKFQIKFSAVK